MATFGRSSSVVTNSERTYNLIKYTDLRIGSNIILEANLFLTFNPLSRVMTISHGRQIVQQIHLAQGKTTFQIRALLDNSSVFISSGSGDIRFRFRTIPAECAEIVRKLQDVVNVEIVNRNNSVLNHLSQSQFPSDFSQSQIFSQSTQDCFSQVPMFSNSQELLSRSASLSNIASNSQLSMMSEGQSSSSMNSFSSGSQNSVAAAFSQSPFVDNVTQYEIKRPGSQLAVSGSQPSYVSSQLLSTNGTSTAAVSAQMPLTFSSSLEQKPLKDKDCEIDFNSLSDEALRNIIQEQLKNSEFRNLVTRLENLNGNPIEKVPEFAADSTRATSHMWSSNNIKEEKVAVPYTPRFTVPEKPSKSQFSCSQSQPGDSLLSRLEALQKY